MEDDSSNITGNFTKDASCHFQTRHLVALSAIDILTFLAGQFVMAKLVWLTFISKKTVDILNFNLALFNNVQYCMSIVHLFALYLNDRHMQTLKFLLVYAQIGGPMSLCLICMERHVAVIRPTSYPLLKKYRFREVSAVLVWLCSVPTACMRVFASDNSGYVSEHVIQSFPVGVMVITTEMMLHTSICIAKALKKAGPGKQELHPAKKRAFKTVCATSTITSFCYAPVAILQQYVFVNERVNDCVVTPVCIVFLSAASVVHPLFYLSTQGKLFSCFK